MKKSNTTKSDDKICPPDPSVSGFPPQGSIEKRTELRDLYKIALEEYRFQVKLNWDRTAFCLTFSSALLSLAINMLKGGRDLNTSLSSFGIFLIGTLGAFIGLQIVNTGRGYYHRAILKKTFLEKDLGYHDHYHCASKHETARFAIGTTPGMRDANDILAHPDVYLARRKVKGFGGKVTDGVINLFYILIFIHAIGMLVCAMNILLARTDSLQSNPTPIPISQKLPSPPKHLVPKKKINIHPPPPSAPTNSSDEKKVMP